MKKKPNIIIVIADDVTPHYHSCYGGKTPTPNIDKLAAKGVRFTNAYCCSSLCNPSRYNIYTGQFTGRAKSVMQMCESKEPYLVHQSAMLEPDQANLVRALKAAGYYTGHVGKWHSRFDTSFIGEEEPKIPYGDPDDPQYDAKLKELQQVAKKAIRESAGFDFVESVNWGNIDSGQKHEKLQYHNIGWQTDNALDFIDQAASKKQPFFLQLENSVPHSPDCTLSLGKDHRYTLGGKLDQPPSSHPDDQTVIDRLKKAGLQTKGPIAGINAGMIMLDDQIGALMEKLDQLGIREDTFIMYTADHGVPGKGTCHLQGFHLPCIMSLPELISEGNVIDNQFSFINIMPTLLEFAGASLPGDHKIDGKSVAEKLKQGSEIEEEFCFHEMGWARSVIKGRYHYISFRYPPEAIQKMQSADCEMLLDQMGLEKGMFGDLNAPFKPHYFDADQFYDIQTDPYERKNLINEPGLAELISEYKEALFKITDTMPGQFPGQPSQFRQSETYKELLAKRKKHVASIVHYPKDNTDVIWFENKYDPEAEAE